MERDQVVALLDEQRKVFNDIVDRLHSEVRKIRDESNKSLQDVIRSLEFYQNETDDLKKRMGELYKEKSSLEKQLDAVTLENKDLKLKLEDIDGRADYIDDQRRQINLRFSGVQEEPRENWQQCQQKVGRILQEKMGISPSFERIHRVGRPSVHRQKPRDIVATFSKISVRDAVFRDRRKLRGSEVFINEDLCPGTVEARRTQMDAFHFARRQGKITFFKHKTLVIREPSVDRRQDQATPVTPATGTPSQSAAGTPSQPMGRPTRALPSQSSPYNASASDAGDHHLSVEPLSQTATTTPRRSSLSREGRAADRVKRGGGAREIRQTRATNRKN